MKRIENLLVLALAVGLPGQLRGAEEFLDPAQLQQAGYFHYWEAQLLLRAGDRIETIELLEDNLYLTTTDGEVLAVDPAVGLLRWTRPVARRTQQIFRPTHVLTADAGETALVVLAAASGITILDRYSGDIVTQFVPKFAISSAAAADRSRLFAGGSDGLLHAILWDNPEYRRPARLWRAITSGVVRAAPVLTDGGLLYAASQGGGVYCCTAEYKELQWEHVTDGPITGEIHVDSNGVYVASADRSVYKFDRLSGEQNWRRRLPEASTSGPTVVGGTVYQHSPGWGLYAIDATYGDVLWTQPDGIQMVARQDAKVCLTGAGERLLIADNKTGHVLARMDLPRRVKVAVNRWDAAVYLVTDLGSLYCARPVGDRPLSSTKLTREHATLNQPPR